MTHNIGNEYQKKPKSVFEESEDEQDLTFIQFEITNTTRLSVEIQGFLPYGIRAKRKILLEDFKSFLTNYELTNGHAKNRQTSSKGLPN
jgi:hypothetical protein